MASTEQLLVRIDATTEQLRRELARAERSLNDFGGRADASLRKVDASFGKLNAAMSTFGRVLGPLAIGLGVREMARFGVEIAKTADQLRLLEGRVRLLGGTSQTFEQLRQVSLKLGTSVESTANAFARFRIAGDDIGLTNRQVLTLTQTVQQLGRIGGASGQELASATLQFSQGLAKGRLDGDELRSVLESMPLLGRAIAESLGVGVGQLRDLGAAGVLTGKVISDAVLGVAQETDEQFKRLPRTLEQASTNLETEWGRLVSALDSRLSVSQTFQFFTQQLAEGVGAAANVIAGPTVQERLRSTLDQIRAIQEQIERTESQSARPSERGFSDPRRTDSDRTASERIARLKQEAAALAELLEREAVHLANTERLEGVERAKVAQKAAEDRIKAVNDLIASYGVEVEILRLSDIERKKREAADKAEAKARKEISGITEAQVATIREAAAASAAEGDAIERSRRQIQESSKASEALMALRVQTIADLQDELGYVSDLTAAHRLGEEAIYAVETARKAELIVQKLKLTDLDIEAGLITELVQKIEDQRRATEGITKAQKDAERAAQKLADEQKKAAEEAVRAYDKVIDSIANISQEKLGDALFSTLKGDTLDFAEFLKDTLLRAIADVAAAALTQQIVIPIAAQAVGAFPGLFGLTGQAAGVARAAGGGGMGGMNPLSLLNSGGGGGLYNSFAMSGIGQSLGLSYGAGTLATNAGLFAAGSGALGTFAAGGPAALALTGPAGGFGSIAGLATASTGGAVGAATAGGALGATGGLTGLGASLGAAVPYIGLALAALSLFGGSIFGGNPSVGPVGVADFAPGLGRGREFDQPLIEAFTGDNGGNGEAMRPIAEAIADIIADSADRFAATIDGSLRFRVANYASPESGSGRMGGFEVNAFIRGQAEDRIAEGLSQEQAIFEALRFAVTEAFTFDSATMTEIAANTAASTTEELLADLEFGRNFDMLNEALSDLGNVVNANTLAAAQLEVAIANQAQDFAESAAEPIIDSLRRALELFPGRVTRDVTTERAIRGVQLPGRDGRFVDEDDPEFDRFTGGEGGLDIITRREEVTSTVSERAANYAANMERVARSIDIANASVDLLVDGITGEFEPAVRGPFQSAIEQSTANLRALAPEFDSINEQIREAYRDFPGLEQSLGTLGDVLIDVTGTINDAINELREQLQQDFNDDITRRMNAATGLGAANVIRDMVTARDTMFTDAAALGIQYPQGGPNPISQLFDAELRQALSGASLDDLGRLLSSGQIVDAGARAIVETLLNEEALAVARQQQVVGLQTLLTETERFASAANDNARTLRNAAAGFLVDANLSPLSPELRLEEARRQFEAAFDLANDNDPTDDLSQDAIQRLPGLSQTMLEASRAYYGSTEGYLADFNRSQDALGSTALRQESIEQQQLTALRDIEAAIQAAGGGVGNPAQQAAAGGFNFGSNVSANQSIYNALTAAGLATPAGFGAGQLSALRASNPAVNALVSALGFNTGGGFTVAGPAGNDNLLMPLRLTAGEAVNVHRGDTMQAVIAKLGAIESRMGEVVQLNRALVFENNQQRAELIKTRSVNERLSRELSERDAQQPRRAYGT